MHSLISVNLYGLMNRLIIFFLFSTAFSNIDVETRQYTFYKNDNMNSIDFYDLIDNFNNYYKIELVDVSDIKFKKLKQIFIEKCDLRFKLKNSNSSIEISRCSDELQYKGNIYIDRHTSDISIDALKYSELSCTLTFWVTGVFIEHLEAVDGYVDGLLKEYYDDGSPKIEFLFDDGKKNGVQKKWYNNGQLEILYNYSEGKLSGLQKKWYQNGVLKGEWHYRADKLHGIITEWYPDKNIKFIKEYDNGILLELIEHNDIKGESY